MNHLPFSVLIDYLDRKLGATTHNEVEAHLTTCDDCQRELEFARRTLTHARHGDLVAPPAGLIQRAVVAFQRKQAAVAQRVRTTATLQFDNSSQVAVMGARGLVKERQLLYNFDKFDLDLQIVADNHPGIIVLRGQLMAQTPPPIGLVGITIRLTSQSDGLWQRLTDELGCFTISGLHADTYALQILLEDREIIIEPLALSG